jgi:hypothetical protein
VTPHLRFEVVACRPGARAGEWQVTWRVENLGQAVVIDSAWVPHGRFRGQGRVNFVPPRALPGGESALLELTVHADEAPGTLVENAFLILRVSLAGAAWRVFARMRIEFDASGAPRPVPELVTLQSAGATE